MFPAKGIGLLEVVFTVNWQVAGDWTIDILNAIYNMWTYNKYPKHVEHISKI